MNLSADKYWAAPDFIAYYLLKELRAPPSTRLVRKTNFIFSTGPLTGIKSIGFARHCIGAKSPLTNSIAKSEAGAFWGSDSKAAGFDV